MRAARLETVGRFAARDVPVPVPGPDELLVRVEACGVCGTDRHLLHGEFPSAPPVTLGHEFCGIVEQMGSAVSGWRTGARITGDPNISCGRCASCLRGQVNLCRNLQAIGIHRDGGFAEYVLVPQGQAFELPASLPPEHGAFCEPLACCLHGIDMAGIQAGSSVVVLGGGVIGLLVVQLARLAGASRVVLATRQASRRALAETLGATASVDPSAGPVVSAVTGPGGLLPGGADVVIECAGVAETMEQSVELVRPGGTALILGVLPQGQKVSIEPFRMLTQEIRLISSFINPFVHRRAADLVAAGTIKVGPLISRRVGLDEIPDVVAHPPRSGEVRVLAIPH